MMNRVPKTTPFVTLRRTVIRLPLIIAVASMASYSPNSNHNQPSSTFSKRQVKGVIFDMDGTLTEHGSIDFAAMYTRNGFQRRHDTDILSLVNALPTEQERDNAMNVILEEELLGIERMKLRPNLHDLIKSLKESEIKTALSTRNCELAYLKFLEKAELHPKIFTPALHRDSLGGINKPDPAIARHVLDHWGIAPGEEQDVIFVGDSIDDMLCGREAGCRTCLITTSSNQRLTQTHPHLVDILIHDLMHLWDHLDK